MPSAHTALILGTAAALAPAPLAPLARAGPHGLTYSHVLAKRVRSGFSYGFHNQETLPDR
jgi:hypothetical protein